MKYMFSRYFGIMKDEKYPYDTPEEAEYVFLLKDVKNKEYKFKESKENVKKLQEDINRIKKRIKTIKLKKPELFI